jgi:hypothetical protein
MRIRVPSKKAREKFLLICELEGCQKAVDFLTKYYKVRRMRIILDGRRVGKGCVGWYLGNRAFFKKEGLTKRIVLHELYHHLVDSNGFELPLKAEEKEANSYAREFLKCAS